MEPLHIIDVARESWMVGPFEFKSGDESARFHHISTDEVYGSLGEEGFFSEESPIAPNSPYSASKTSSDMIVRGYFHTFRMNVVTTNCFKNYGLRQHLEKLIPTIIRKALAEEEIPIYGDGKNVRDWLYVDDHVQAIDLVFHKGRSGETYYIGGNNEKTKIEIAHEICDALAREKPRTKGSYKDLVSFVKDRPGHDKRYAIDATKIEKKLEWRQGERFSSGILKVVGYYLSELNSDN